MFPWLRKYVTTHVIVLFMVYGCDINTYIIWHWWRNQICHHIQHMLPDCFLNEESTVFCCTSELSEVTKLNLIYFYFVYVHDYVPFVVWTMTFVVRFRYSPKFNVNNIVIEWNILKSLFHNRTIRSNWIYSSEQNYITFTLNPIW